MLRLMNLPRRAASSLAALVFACACAPAFAQPATMPVGGMGAADAANLPSADAVMDKYLDATGGRAAYEKVTSRRAVGTMSIPAQNLTGQVEMLVEAPDKGLMSMELAGIGKIVQGRLGEVVYEANPLTRTRLVTGPERELLLRSLALDSYNAERDLYPNRKTSGTAEVDGKTCYVVELDTGPAAGGAEATMSEKRFYDTQTGLLVATEGTVPSPMGSVKVETALLDYAEFDGLKMPMRTVTKMAGIEMELKFTGVTQNQDIPDEQFALPPAVKRLVDRAATTGPATAPAAGGGMGMGDGNK